MRSHRAWVDAELCAGAEIALDERTAHQVVRVLRARRGDRLVLFDGRGTEARAEIVSAHRRHGCSVRVLDSRPVSRESPLRVELVQAVAKGDKLDRVVRMTTELGLAAFRPVFAERSEARVADADRRLARWREIAISACEQCGRTVLPTIHEPVPVEDLGRPAGTGVVLTPGGATPLSEILPGSEGLTIAIGPEGGWSERDRGTLESLGYRAADLGPRVLRTETAGAAALAIVQSHHGDLRSQKESARDG